MASSRMPICSTSIRGDGKKCRLDKKDTGLEEVQLVED